MRPATVMCRTCSAAAKPSNNFEIVAVLDLDVRQRGPRLEFPYSVPRHLGRLQPKLHRQRRDRHPLTTRRCSPLTVIEMSLSS